MAKKEKTMVYVVDFLSKKLLLKEELINTSSKKEEDKMDRINSAIDCLKYDMDAKQKAS